MYDPEKPTNMHERLSNQCRLPLKLCLPALSPASGNIVIGLAELGGINRDAFGLARCAATLDQDCDPGTLKRG